MIRMTRSSKNQKQHADECWYIKIKVKVLQRTV
jgi:hypothetical protein